MNPGSGRLESLDVLRGFDLFCLTILCPLLWAFYDTGHYSWLQPVMQQFSHVQWAGFALWDLVMPLFMFMAGVSVPFAFGKYLKAGEGYGKIYKRIFRRVIVLWILGMVCQGNLFALDINVLKLFSNTLQAIAVGYLISAVIYLHCRPKGQIFVTVGLLGIYWALLTFVSVDGYGGGDYTAQGNLAEWVDRVVLGRWRDGACLDESGKVIFLQWYDYTWILSSLNFGATVMTGVFAGEILKSRLDSSAKWKWLFGIGTAMVAIGWLWGLQMPVIKRIWTSSMVLVSSGYCFWLMGLFYYLIDYKGYRKGWTWLKVIGMNSILAYVLSAEVGVISFSCIGHSVFWGMRQYIGSDFYHLLILTINIGLVYSLLYVLYRHKIFLKA
ncbi:acyltransferase family protein [Culturomica massiliensis]|uniref:acyltransferase family protein n=1 Tax=Culturomica massiliensis TaxID=1841857 RepID=UPI00266ED8A9|nr:DUF5009 domain-containing protein [Culturomica massiliensis]